MPRNRIHHEGDGWHVDLVDYDPVRGAVIIGTLVVATFTAAWLTVDRFRRLLGGAS